MPRIPMIQIKEMTIEDAFDINSLNELKNKSEFKGCIIKFVNNPHNYKYHIWIAPDNSEKLSYLTAGQLNQLENAGAVHVTEEHSYSIGEDGLIEMLSTMSRTEQERVLAEARKRQGIQKEKHDKNDIIKSNIENGIALSSFKLGLIMNITCINSLHGNEITIKIDKSRREKGDSPHRQPYAKVFTYNSIIGATNNDLDSLTEISNMTGIAFTTLTEFNSRIIQYLQKNGPVSKNGMVLANYRVKNGYPIVTIVT